MLSAHLDELLRFAATTEWKVVPEEVRQRARLSAADTLAVMCGGRDLGAAAVARRYLQRFEGGPIEGRAIEGRDPGPGWADGQRTDRQDAPQLSPGVPAGGLTPASAAWLAGIAGHVLDYDDTHWPTILHASNPILAALLASGAITDGRALLEAYLVGFECGARVALSMPKGHYDRGWHVTGTVGGIGAAAAVSRLLGAGPEEMRRALSLAANQASGHRQHFGSMAKSLNGGNAARTGLVSALLAHEGFLPDPEGLEGRRGMWEVMSEGPDAQALDAGLGSEWEMLSNGIKPYPSGVVTHPSIEAAEELRGRLGDLGRDLEEIARIELTVHPLVSELTNKEVSAELDVKFSVKTLVAMGLAGGVRDRANYSASALGGRHDLGHLAGLVSVVDDRGSGPEEAEILVELRDGTRLRHQVSHVLGSPARPLSADQVWAKFSSLWPAQSVAGPADQAFEQLLALEDCADARAVVTPILAVVVDPSPAG